jgi:hypothetical protein
MDSFYGQLFLKLQEHIKLTVPEIRWIDTDIGQIDFYDVEAGPPAIAMPAVLIDFPDTGFDEMGQLAEMGNPVLDFRLVFAPISNTSSVTPLFYKEKGLAYFELEHRLYQALKGFDAAGLCQPLNRRSAITEKREPADGLRVRKMSFSTSFEDYSATPQYQTVARPALAFDNDLTGI